MSSYSMARRAYTRARIYGGSCELRQEASACSHWALMYAVKIDLRGEAVTRAGVLCDPGDSYSYAVYVDRGFHPDTYKAVRGTPWEARYLRELGWSIPRVAHRVKVVV